MKNNQNQKFYNFHLFKYIIKLLKLFLELIGLLERQFSKIFYFLRILQPQNTSWCLLHQQHEATSHFVLNVMFVVFQQTNSFKLAATKVMINEAMRVE